MSATTITIYWAAPLFTQAERIWNRMCAEYLRDKGYEVILPQDEANKFISGDGTIDFEALAKGCLSDIRRSNVVTGVLDGADSDSGTSFELGYALREADSRKNMQAHERMKVIGIRTDFRASEDESVNAMFRMLDHIIYFPSFNESYEELCDRIDEVIHNLRGQELIPAF